MTAGHSVFSRRGFVSAYLEKCIEFLSSCILHWIYSCAMNTFSMCDKRKAEGLICHSGTVNRWNVSLLLFICTDSPEDRFKE